MSAPGWVYVLSNPTLPGLVKIGQTTGAASARAKQLNREYGVADAFEVVSKHATPDAEAVERIAHRMLADCRQPRSELFACSPVGGGENPRLDGADVQSRPRGRTKATLLLG